MTDPHAPHAHPHLSAGRAPALASVLADAVSLTSLASGGVVVADPGRVDDVEGRLREAGWLVVAVDTAQVSTARQAQAVIAAALGLPESAGRNLDALVDSLRDLPDRLGGARRVALSWRGAGRVAEVDRAGHDELVEILSEASETLWGQAGSGGFAVETVLFEGRA